MRRIVMAIGLVMVGAMGMQAFAGPSKEAPARGDWQVNDRLRALELEVYMLQAREAALTAYVMENEKRADGLDRLEALCRKQGFASGAFSTLSRDTLLKGLVGLAASLRTGLPVVTEEETALAATISEFLGAAEKRGTKK